MTLQEFADAVLRHQRFVHGEMGGKRTELRFADLSGLRLPKINLSVALMAGVNLSHSSLKEADLSFADMFCENLERAGPI